MFNPFLPLLFLSFSLGIFLCLTALCSHPPFLLSHSSSSRLLSLSSFSSSSSPSQPLPSCVRQSQQHIRGVLVHCIKGSLVPSVDLCFRWLPLLDSVYQYTHAMFTHAHTAETVFSQKHTPLSFVLFLPLLHHYYTTVLLCSSSYILLNFINFLILSSKRNVWKHKYHL